MQELPVEDPGHMASADRQLHDWEDYITGKRLTDDTSSDDVRSLFLLHPSIPPSLLYLSRFSLSLLEPRTPLYASLE